MKITSFNPLIVTTPAQAEELVKLFEELGFERRHTVEDIDDKDITNYDLKDANGFRVDVAGAPNMQQDMTLIRMNVDDFDEALEYLKSCGFTLPSGRVVESKSAKSARVVSPSGFAFDLCKHIK